MYLHGFGHTDAQWRAVHSLLPPEPFWGLTLPFHQAGAVDSFDAALTSLWHQVDVLVGADACVILAGYSLGARLALGMALARPARVAGLLLASVHLGLSRPIERVARAAADARWAKRFAEEPLPEVLAAFRAQPVFGTATAVPAGLAPESPGAKLARAAQAARLTLNKQQLAAHFAVLGLAAMPDWQPRWPMLEVPTTLLVGDRDSKFAALATAARRTRPATELIVAPSAGHDVLWDAPKVVASALQALRPAARAQP